MSSLTISNLDSPSSGSDEWTTMKSIPYRETIGSLTHIARLTRPDIAFAVGACSRYLQNPGISHWNAVKNILRYLKGSSSFTLMLNPENITAHSSTVSDKITSIQGQVKFLGFTDSDWAGDLDMSRSTSGYGFFIGSALVSWMSKAQPTVAPSSTYAETIAAYSAASGCIWSRNFLESFNFADFTKPTPIFCDNEQTISNSKHHMVTARNKSFHTRYQWTREQVTEGTLSLVSIPTKDNISDIFTKPLKKTLFQYFRTKLGVLNVLNDMEIMCKDT
jgi:hypothetical protein